MHIHATHPREGEGRAHVMQVDVDDITFEMKMHTIHTIMNVRAEPIKGTLTKGAIRVMAIAP